MRALIAEELATSARIVAGGHDVAPRFLLDSPQGRLTVLCQWPQDETAQRIAFSWVADFFRWRQVTSFLMSSELIQPPSIVTIYVARSEADVVLQPIKPGVGTTGPAEHLGPDAVDEMILALLPRGAATLEASRAADLATIFAVIDEGDVEAVVVRFGSKGEPLVGRA